MIITPWKLNFYLKKWLLLLQIKCLVQVDLNSINPFHALPSQSRATWFSRGQTRRLSKSHKPSKLYRSAIYFDMGVVATTIFKQLEKISTQRNRMIELMVERSEKTVK